MHLLNVHTLALESFSRDPPPYACLSHRWGRPEDEVSFRDIKRLHIQPDVQRKPGFTKILRCKLQAIKHGLDYIWIDTCCIDQSINTELHEAINSMWQWYQDCDRCFVYMNDVRSDQPPNADDSDFARSQWFRRGWTLQELLAPLNVTFFARDWKKIGKKAHQALVGRMSRITGIPANVLSVDGPRPESFSVARRMFWASQRETTRKEDMAYSLMGIMGVTMPIIYGGSENSFVRFQKEIMKNSHDQSIFAWVTESAPPSTTTGLLTSSPAYFTDVDEIPFNDFVVKFSKLMAPDPPPKADYSHTNNGIRITLPMKPVEGDSLYLAMLRCTLLDEPSRPLCIYLQQLAGPSNQNLRQGEHILL
ncbi:hypothetical protein HYDPIDRAFT_32581 [Hydnomerulius pinastri MD-312]|uniref:Heterokaryon incompatibility domain-containing protein n=1 Tax=Hydnomerulius pinastri MD-312 TaxID=994086 RepID=A0A0C9WAJ2_9AGAM|nr:hypothetical protein HYDPIDRAFT_32581 [Hydnomerulius pinastri MD-312]